MSSMLLTIKSTAAWTGILRANRPFGTFFRRQAKDYFNLITYVKSV